MKYIIMEKAENHEKIAIVFDDMFTHKMIARGASTDWEHKMIAWPYSAGFIENGIAIGESDSLGIQSQEGDTEIIKEFYPIGRM